MTVLIIIGALCVAVSALVAACGILALRRDRREFRVINVTKDRRTVELLGALSAAHQAKTDAALQAEYDDRTKINRERRKQVRERMRLIHGDKAAYQMHPVFRRQAG